MSSIIQQAQQAVGLVQGVSNLINGASSAFGVLGGAPTFWRQLRPASFRGVPFAVTDGDGKFGRRNAIHEYPFRDVAWVEDLGKSARRFHVTGFIIGDDVIAQRGRMIAAVEKAGDGELVHPTYGKKTVSLIDFETTERWDEGRIFELRFSFIEAGKRIYPSNVKFTGAAIKQAAAAADRAAQANFMTRAMADLQSGAAVATQALGTAQLWADRAFQIVNSASGLFGRLSSLNGQFGRYSLSSLGFLALGAALPDSGLSAQDLAGQAAAARTDVGASSDGMMAAVGSMGADSASIGAFAGTAQGLSGSVQAFSASAPDAMKAMLDMGGFSAPLSVLNTPVGTAMNDMGGAMQDLFNRASVTGLARAAADYQPVSADDAASARNLVCTALDTHITLAGDQGEDATFSALCSLRTAVVEDFSAKGAGLPSIATLSTVLPVPALVLAHSTYQDAGRVDELIMQAGAPHPAFMPTSFKALSA